MKINGAGGINGPKPISANYKLSKLYTQNKTQLPSGGDKVSISEEALAFSKIFTEAKEVAAARDPDIVSRIAELKEKIATGTYHVDSEELAESILGSLYI